MRMNKQHFRLIRQKLNVFCFSFTETHIKAIITEPCDAYLVLLQSPLGPGIIRCRIINNLYAEARVIQGSA